MSITSRDPCIEFVPLWRFPHDVTWKKLIACPYSSIGENSCLSLIYLVVRDRTSRMTRFLPPSLPFLADTETLPVCGIVELFLPQKWQNTIYNLNSYFRANKLNTVLPYDCVSAAGENFENLRLPVKLQVKWVGSLITQPFSCVKWVENAV